MNEETKPKGQSPQNTGCLGAMIGLAVFAGGVYWLASLLLSRADFTPKDIAISPDVRASMVEHSVALAAKNTILSSCGTIEMVTPSSSGGYIIDCSNGDRYRVAPGSSSATFDRRY